MDIILKYFPNLNSIQKEKMEYMGKLYTEWNEKINVVSRKDIDALFEKHVLHSLSIAKIISLKNGSSVLDVGTGGGFPGIPLAIYFPEVKFHLVDSIGKKIKVVNAVAETLELANVFGEQKRAEELKTKYDFIVSRAVTAFPKFVDWVKDKTFTKQVNAMPNGIIYLKGGDFEEETKPFGKRVSVYSISDFFDESFFETKKIIHLAL